MRPDRTKQYLPCLMLGLGVVAFVLRLCLYAFGVDDKGLLVPGHALQIFLWAVTAAAVAVALIFHRGQKGTPEAPAPQKSSALAGAGALLLALGILAAALGGGEDRLGAAKLCGVAGIPAAAAALWAAVCRLRGKQVYFLCHGLICVFFALCMVAGYQAWSGTPQFQDYIFSVAGLVLLALLAYQNTALAAGMGSHSVRRTAAALAAFACIAAAAHTENVLLYITGALWALTDLWTAAADGE